MKSPPFVIAVKPDKSTTAPWPTLCVCIDMLKFSGAPVDSTFEPVLKLMLDQPSPLLFMFSETSDGGRTLTLAPALHVRVWSAVNVTLVPEFNNRAISPEVTVAPATPSPVVASLVTVIFVGSNSHSPALPAGAAADPLAPVVNRRCPEVSMAPPSPPAMPPRAVIWPPTRVTEASLPVSDQSTTRPPSPRRIA